MAVSQTLTVTEVANSVNVTDNTSQVKIKWVSTQTYDSYNANVRTAYYWISINGEAEEKYSVSYTLPKNTAKVILEKTITVKHKDDGTGSVTVRTEMDTQISAGVVKKTATCELTDIPRATTIDALSCNTNYFTGKLTYKYTPKSDDFYNRVGIALNKNGAYIAVKTINLGKKITAQQTASVTLDAGELEMIYKELRDTAKSVLRFTLRTYSDSGYSKQVGDGAYKEITLTIPNDATTQADVTMALTPVGDFNGLYIQGKSKVHIALSADGKFDAAIGSYSSKIGSKAYAGDNATSGFLTDPGIFTVYGYAKDSRGYTGSTTQEIEVIAYSKPKLLEADAVRCDSDGNPSDNGTYLKICAARSYSPVRSDGAQRNFCEIRYRYKLASAAEYSDWDTLLAKDDLTADRVETGALLGGVISVASSYHVHIEAIDDIGEKAETSILITTGKVYWHRDGARNSFTFGGYVEEDNTFAITNGVKFKVNPLVGETVTLEDTGWVDLGLSESVQTANSNFGRIGSGCAYRVINGNHVYVAFNCACAYAGAYIQVNLNLIPEQYRPARNVYTIAPTNGKRIARVLARNDGTVLLEYVQLVPSDAETTEATVNWVDGYLDYWL